MHLHDGRDADGIAVVERVHALGPPAISAHFNLSRSSATRLPPPPPRGREEPRPRRTDRFGQTSPQGPSLLPWHGSVDFAPMLGEEISGPPLPAAPFHTVPELIAARAPADPPRPAVRHPGPSRPWQGLSRSALDARRRAVAAGVPSPAAKRRA